MKPLKHDRSQVGTCSIDGSGVARRTTADNHHVLHWVEEIVLSCIVVVVSCWVFWSHTLLQDLIAVMRAVVRCSHGCTLARACEEQLVVACGSIPRTDAVQPWQHQASCSIAVCWGACRAWGSCQWCSLVADSSDHACACTQRVVAYSSGGCCLFCCYIVETIRCSYNI